MKKYRYLAIPVVAMLAFAVIALLVQNAPPSEPLKYVIIPADDPGTARDSYAPVVEYLSEAIGREISLVVVPNYATAVEAMKYGHADIARFGSAGYVRAIEEGADIEPFVTGVKEATGLPGYYCYVFARADRHITTLDGKTFAFVDAGSTSGYVLPAAHFEKEGIEIGKVFMAGSHPAVILAVKNGTVDAGATASNRYHFAEEEGIVEEGELEILWQSPLVPTGPITVQSSMDARLKARLKQAFLDMPREIAECTGTKETGFVEMRDSDYDVIRELEALTNK